MLNIDEIQNGIVIDHIKAGTAIGLMDLLGIKGNRTSSVALIQNARSHKAESGRKDIIKVEGDASWLNLDVLAYLDPDISVTVIENGKAVKKEKPQPPKRLVNIVRCKNPRCISSIEEECDQIFELSSNGKYRCIYCEQEALLLILRLSGAAGASAAAPGWGWYSAPSRGAWTPPAHRPHS